MSLRERINQLSGEPKRKQTVKSKPLNKYVSLKDGELRSICISDIGTTMPQTCELITCEHCGVIYYTTEIGRSGKYKYCPHCGVVTEDGDDT